MGIVFKVSEFTKISKIQLLIAELFLRHAL